MVEEGAVAIGGRFHLLQKLGEEGDVKSVDLRHALDLIRVVSVVGKRVVGIGDSGFGVDAVARFTRQLKGGDTSDVALEGEHLQLEHEAGVIPIGGGDAIGSVEIGKGFIAGRGFGFLNASLDLTDAGEIVIDLGAIGWS